MFEIARNIERIAANLSPVISVTVGLVAVLVGLFVWLGGLGLRKLLVAIVGAAAGGLCAFFIASLGAVPALVLAAAAGCLAVIFEQVIITLLIAGLAAFSAFDVLAALNKVSLSDGLKHAYLNMPAYSWAVIAAFAAVFMAAGFYFWRLTSALCCAAFGTLIIFAGMIVLLLNKGTAPVSYISTRPSFFAAALVAMLAFGTIVQLLFCRPPGGHPAGKKKATGRPDGASETPQKWRNR